LLPPFPVLQQNTSQKIPNAFSRASPPKKLKTHKTFWVFRASKVDLADKGPSSGQSQTQHGNQQMPRTQQMKNERNEAMKS